MSYFANAPMSMFIFISTATSSLLTKNVGRVELDLTHLQNGEISRLLFSQLTFPTTAQFLMGMILIFNVRHLERQLGAKKFSAFVCLSYGVSVALQIAAVTMGSMMDAPIIPATGPYFFIFSCLPLYYYYIPSLSPVMRFGGVQLSEKSIIYVFALQLCFGAGFSSLLSSLSGLVTGYAYRSDGLGLQNLRLPKMIENTCGRVVGMLNGVMSWIASAIPTNRAPRPRTGGGGGEIQQPGHQLVGNDQWQQTAMRQSQEADDEAMLQRALMESRQMSQTSNTTTTQAAPTPVQPSEADINTIMALGFDRSEASNALVSTASSSGQTSVEAAANMLFSSNRMT